MQLVSMGFDLEGCKRGIFNTQNQGTTKLIDTTILTPPLHTHTPIHTHTHTFTHTHPHTHTHIHTLTFTHPHTHTGVELAMNWILEHMGDPGTENQSVDHHS